MVTHYISCSHCDTYTYLSLNWLKQLQPINRMLCSINTKPPWHHTTNGNTQQIHSHTTHMLKSGSTWSLNVQYSPYGDLLLCVVMSSSKCEVAVYSSAVAGPALTMGCGRRHSGPPWHTPDTVHADHSAMPAILDYSMSSQSSKHQTGQLAVWNPLEGRISRRSVKRLLNLFIY